MNLEKRRKRQKSIQKQYDKTARNLPFVGVGDHKYFQSLEENDPKVKLPRRLGYNCSLQLELQRDERTKETKSTCEEIWNRN